MEKAEITLMYCGVRINSKRKKVYCYVEVKPKDNDYEIIGENRIFDAKLHTHKTGAGVVFTFTYPKDKPSSIYVKSDRLVGFSNKHGVNMRAESEAAEGFLKSIQLQSKIRNTNALKKSLTQVRNAYRDIPSTEEQNALLVTIINYITTGR